jgi:hypothetical protein
MTTINERKIKSQEERMDEMKRLYKQIYDLGLSRAHDGINEFMLIANEYVKNATSASGSIPLHGLKRDLLYTLSIQKHIPCSITLKFNKER